MPPNYISRTLIQNLGRSDQRIIQDSDIPEIGAPIVILGDPGLGKTKLTETLAHEFGYLRVPAGTFYRNQSKDRFRIEPSSKLVIDGLDEIAASSGISPIDEVLKKLSALGNPSFILSCRSADWQGSVDRHKISTDYGEEPTTLHLQPFSYDDAKSFLENFDSSINAQDVLDELYTRDLSDFYTNPLTLSLIAEVASAGKGLPKGQSELLGSATELLSSEQNRAHQQSPTAQASLNVLLDSAGAIFAHVLLSGSSGVTDRARSNIPDGYIPVGELTGTQNAPELKGVIKTRLFQSPDEGLFIPFHRIVAEYLGARWLSKQINAGASERRIFQLFTFARGVPTALRGIHAWMAHFSPNLTARCIKTDPYGVLRYGDSDKFSLDKARLLLNSLSSLASEDPYFRSEDWGRRSIAGIARAELKDEIVQLIKNPDRHTHLSTLALEALEGSPLTSLISHELLLLVKDSTAAYVERFHAAEALFSNQTNINWSELATDLAQRGVEDKRLNLEIIAIAKGSGFSAHQIAGHILDYRKADRHPIASNEDDDEDEDQEDRETPYVSGMVFSIASKISPEKAGEIMDAIVQRLEARGKPNRRRSGYELSRSIQQVLERAIENSIIPTPVRAWSWLKILDREGGYSSEPNAISEWLETNADLRRGIQRSALNSTSPDGAWMTIIDSLPSANQSLTLTVEDSVIFLTEIGSKNNLSDSDIDIWSAILQTQQRADGFPGAIQSAADLGRNRHQGLELQWAAITAPPKRDWRKENETRQARDRKKKLEKYDKDRAVFLPAKAGISHGQELGVLKQIANAYLGLYSDSDSNAAPHARVLDWLGEELTDAALRGFVEALSRSDVPTAQQIAETHAEGKEWSIERILICGVAEVVRSGAALGNVRREVLEASLIAWWQFADFNSKQLGNSTQSKLEESVFSSEDRTQEFLAATMTPRIRAGHEHIPGLYRFMNDKRFETSARKFAVQWLRSYPDANTSVQQELIQIALELSNRDELKSLINDRLISISALNSDLQKTWMAAGFFADFDNHRSVLCAFFQAEKSHIWNLRRMSRSENPRTRNPLSLRQLEFIIVTYAVHWPPVPHPSSSWGETNPWNATEFIRSCINAVGTVPTADASTCLDRLILNASTSAYHDHLKHIRSQQLRLRRDAEYRVPSFSELKSTLANDLPTSIDDLKALTLDKLELIQDYIRNSDTDPWDAFWNADKPKNENTCRHRLLDFLRARLPAEIQYLPETLMPDSKRADIVAFYREYGIPIEIKGQWHPDVWNAASVQLIEKYAVDWRADDRGIYLVFWFGDVPGKNLPGHPEGHTRPSSALELQRMLADRIPLSTQGNIDVVVIDASKPKRL